MSSDSLVTLDHGGQSARSPIADVLLVEDNESDVILTRRALERVHVGIRMHHVQDGADCLSFLRKEGDNVDAPIPFPPKEKLGGANISPGKIGKIQRMIRQGFHRKVIAEEVGVNLQTVSRWPKRTGSKSNGRKPKSNRKSDHNQTNEDQSDRS